MGRKRPRKKVNLDRRAAEISARLAELPRGTIKKRVIYGHAYYYLQHREGKKVVHKYVGKTLPKELKQQLSERQKLRAEDRKIFDLQF